MSKDTRRVVLFYKIYSYATNFCSFFPYPSHVPHLHHAGTTAGISPRVKFPLDGKMVIETKTQAQTKRTPNKLHFKTLKALPLPSPQVNEITNTNNGLSLRS